MSTLLPLLNIALALGPGEWDEFATAAESAGYTVEIVIGGLLATRMVRVGSEIMPRYVILPPGEARAHARRLCHEILTTQTKCLRAVEEFGLGDAAPGMVLAPAAAGGGAR